jgi:deoxyribonuclease V
MPPLHDWNLSEADAVEVQRRLAPLVDTGTPLGPITTLAGCDIAYDTTSDVAWAAVVVMTFPDLIEIERVVVREEVTFPYVPGLLSFRECPPLLSALSRLRKLPDVVILDAQGIAHPRKFGSACHLGLWLGVPTVGCAKTWLCGEHPEVGPTAGDHAPLTMEGEPVGAVVRSATNVRTVSVSPGHRADITSSVQLVTDTLSGYRHPTPTRMAHMAANAARAAEVASRGNGEKG